MASDRATQHPPLSQQALGTLAMAATAILWSSFGISVKIVDWNPFAISAGRSISAVFFLLLIVRRKKGRPSLSFDQVSGALLLAVTVILFTIATKRTTAANAILLQYAAPLYVAILGAFMLKEKPKIEHWLALAAIAFGMFFFFKDSLGGGTLLGDSLAVISGVTYALQLVMLRKQRADSPFDSLLLGNIFIALISVGVALFMPPPVLNLTSVLAVVLGGIVQGSISTILFAYAIKRITALESILTAVIEPILNPLWVFLFLGEIPGRGAIFGGMIIIAAILGSSLISVRRSSKESIRSVER
ncbi:MAG: EamA family transporter [Spirochaetia bacterium]|nr:EamA family transporter [Spirochaetia bacterium]MCE1209883.1 EamA family transporter [Spirochaetia bacterium]